MKKIEDKFAERIISYLGKDPVVSADISTRLEFARNTAIKTAMLKAEPKQKKNYFTFDLFKSKIAWATSAALALVIFGTSTEISFITQTSSYTEEISYHIEADNIPPEFYIDEN